MPKSWTEPLVQKLIRRHQGKAPETILADYAESIRKEARQDRLPINVELIASVLGVKPRRADYDFAGRIYAEASGQLVMDLNATDLPPRQRFTCAHELMHLAFPGFRRDARYRLDAQTGASGRNSEEEYLCDFGAAALLMPESLIAGSYDVREGLTAVERLSQDANVSLQAAGNRLVALANAPSAFLVFEWTNKPADRPALRRGEDVPKKVRLRYASVAKMSAYLPRFKGADDGSAVVRAWHSSQRQRGREPLPGADRAGVFNIEAKAYGSGDRRAVYALARRDP